MPSEMLVNGVEDNYTAPDVELGGEDESYVQIWSAANSTAIVSLYARNDTTSPYYNLNADTTDPTLASPTIWWLPSVPRLRVVVSGYGGGTIYVSLVRQKHRGQ